MPLRLVLAVALKSTEVDDGAAARNLESLVGSLVGEHGAAYVHGEHLVPVRDRHVASVGWCSDGGGVRHGIKGTQVCVRFFESDIDAELVRHVDRYIGRVSRPRCGGLGTDRSSGVVGDVHPDH